MQNLLLFLLLNTSPAIHTDSLLFINSGIKKPTGQGTGLGLSLAYDIVKAHGGEIMLETKKSADLPAGSTGTIFTIELPNN
jgi:signal transduction histidine kinase